MITPKGTSVCTKSIDDDASTLFNPVYTSPYVKVPPISDTINKSLRSFFGIGNHQIKIKAAIVNRRPINKKGGNCCIAGFAIAKPKPKSNGAHNASRISRNFIRDSHRFDLNT